MATTAKKPNFVFGQKQITHTHKLEDGTEIVCNSSYCDYMDAHPLDQPNQRPPWSNVKREE